MLSDVLSLNGSEDSRLSIASPRQVNNGDLDVNIPSTFYPGQWQGQGDISAFTPSHNSVTEICMNLGGGADSRLISDTTVNQVKPVFLHEISSVDQSPSRGDGLLDNCGIIPNNCLPCLPSTVPSVEKRRSLSSSPPSSRKKAALKLSFKWKEGHTTLREYYSC